uniref:HTH myb-type domain-containing protein n=1 Tax=Lactuca sativa TaxID=4236 RepID=A0A9R1XFY5_LACSA|nr:hypothetical protein LSAT_V11C400219860 [Lactuca sativa]
MLFGGCFLATMQWNFVFGIYLLEQIGISQKCNLESLGFTLEPTLPKPSSPSPSSSPIQKETPLLIPPSPVLEKNEVEHVNARSEEEEGKQVADSIKIYQLSQRRTRRPFSVSEVQALVEAVETLLGAGTWRDVKMRAFDDANHQTYVDLKINGKLWFTQQAFRLNKEGESRSHRSFLIGSWQHMLTGLNIKMERCKEKLM